MKPHSPAEKMMRIRTMSAKNKARLVVNKEVGRAHLKDRKEKLQQKLDEKFRKLFFRQGKDVEGI